MKPYQKNPGKMKFSKEDENFGKTKLRKLEEKNANRSLKKSARQDGKKSIRKNIIDAIEYFYDYLLSTPKMP